jgi:Xaa-Pro aminopeptidase
MFDPQVYSLRRERLAREMRDRGAAGSVLFFAHDESPVNYPANCYPFRQDSNWLYFLGLNEPGMAAVLDTGSGETLLFGDEPALDDVIWTGPRTSLGERAAASGADRVLPLSKLESCCAGRNLHFPPSARASSLRRIASLSGIPEELLRNGASIPLIRAIVSLREIKEDREIAELERAVEVTVAMHEGLLSALEPGWTERKAASFVQSIALDHGCGLSFATIATTHGEVLHNPVADRPCSGQDMFLLDAGAELPSGYAGDLTTSFPVGGGFSPRRRELYALLLEVFRSATAMLAPGIPFASVHLKASHVLAEGLKALGIMKGDPAEAVAAGAHALFFPHGLGHMIGLDVHDMEGLGEDHVGYGDKVRSSQFGLRSLRLAKPLVPGMVHSVEPGIYFIPGLMEKWESLGLQREFVDYGTLSAWKDCGGMRVEEDWLVTQEGARRLGPHLDRSIEALEKRRRSVSGLSRSGGRAVST